MDYIQFVTYKGKKILVEDFTNTKADAEFLARLNRAQKIIAAEPPKSVLAVFNARGASFNAETLSAMKKFTEANTPNIKAAAVVGIDGMLKIALSAVSSFSGRKFISFGTCEEAMDWLIRVV